MKRSLIILLLCIVHCTLSIAQPKLNKEEFYLGVQGGVGASQMYFNPGVVQPIKLSPLGATGGLVFRYCGHRVCGLQVELNYMQRGWAEEVSEGETEGYKRIQHYLEIPFLTHLYFGKGRARGFFNVGPQIGYLLKENSNGKEPSWATDAWTSDQGSGTYRQYVQVEKPFDWGVAGGLGFYYRTPRAGTYQFEARFSYSLGAQFSTSRMDYFMASNSMHLGIMLAYMWEFQRRNPNRATYHL